MTKCDGMEKAHLRWKVMKRCSWQEQMTGIESGGVFLIGTGPINKNMCMCYVSISVR